VDTELDAVTVNLKLLLMSNVNGIEALRLKGGASLTSHKSEHAGLTAHSSQLTAHSSQLTAHSSYIRRPLFPFIPSD
jgi:hypothetical protein